MPLKDKEKRRAYDKQYKANHPQKYDDKAKERMKEYYLKNKEKYKRAAYGRMIEIARWLAKLKSTLQCITCGESHISCIDFHHRNPEEKQYNISRVTSSRLSKENILKEIAKCDPICANCHRKIHWDERMEYLNKRDTGQLESTKIRSEQYLKRRYKECKKNARWFIDYKKDLNCIKCPENNPGCLSFHHRDKNNKKFDISRGVAQGLSIKTILSEIAKCDILCENCHRKLHWEEKQDISK